MKLSADAEAEALARLWLSDPDDGGERASAEYHRLFLDGVPPYASAFLDERGFAAWSDEPRDWWPSSWRPPGWVRAASTDHLGTALLALAAWPMPDVETASDVPAGTPANVPAAPAAAWHLAAWAPVATFALRSYAPEAPYRELAERTDALVLDSLGGSARATDLGDWPTPPDTSADDELALRAVVGWLAAPRRAGWCITVPDLARVSSALDLPGARTTGRRDALATLFHTAGRDGAIDQLLGALDDEAARAQAHYGQLATAWPAWADFGREWAAQVAVTRGFLARLRSLAEVALRP